MKEKNCPIEKLSHNLSLQKPCSLCNLHSTENEQLKKNFQSFRQAKAWRKENKLTLNSKNANTVVFGKKKTEQIRAVEKQKQLKVVHQVLEKLRKNLVLSLNFHNHIAKKNSNASVLWCQIKYANI